MTQLALAVDSTDELWTLDDLPTPEAPYVEVGDELIEVRSRFPSSYYTLTGETLPPRIRVRRGIAGTTKASHIQGSTLTPNYGLGSGGGGGAIAVLEDPGNVWEALTVVALGYRIAYTDPTHGARVHVFEVTTAGLTGADAGFGDLLSDPPVELELGGVVPSGTAEFTYVGIVGALAAATPAFAVLPRGMSWTIEDGLAITSSSDAAPQDSVLVISDNAGLELFRLYSTGDGDWTARSGAIISLKTIGDGAGNDVALTIEDDEGFGGTINLQAGGMAMISVENSGGVKGLAFFGGVAPTTQPTGVAVTAEAIHAALVSLGLITGP